MEIAPDSSIFALLAGGFIIGLYHAFEPDHLAAVSAIVSEKKNVLTSALVGGLWGLGHTISLFAVGVLVIFLKLQISESTEAKLEAAVGFMLIILGVNALRNIFTAEEAHIHTHEHDGIEHKHLHIHDDEKVDASHHGLSPRSVLVGMVHGLAGSAALMVLVVPTIESPAAALFYIAVFGIGSVGGMMLMSLLMSLPITLTADRFAFMNKGIRTLAGLFSLVWGGMLVYEKLIAG